MTEAKTTAVKGDIDAMVKKLTGMLLVPFVPENVHKIAIENTSIVVTGEIKLDASTLDIPGKSALYMDDGRIILRHSVGMPSDMIEEGGDHKLAAELASVVSPAIADALMQTVLKERDIDHSELLKRFPFYVGIIKDSVSLDPIERQVFLWEYLRNK